MAILSADPNVASYTSNVGGGGGGGRLNVDLKPRHERSLSADQVIDELRPEVRPRCWRARRSDQSAGDSYRRHDVARPVSVLSLDTDTDELYRAGPGFEQALRGVPGLQDVNSDLQIKNPELAINLDREQIAALGLTVDQVDRAVVGDGSRQISKIFAPNDEYQVIMQVAPEYQQDPAALSMLDVQSHRGQAGAPSAVVTARQSVGPQSVNHIGQLPSVTPSFNIAPAVSPGDAVGERTTGARDASEHGVGQLPGDGASVPGVAARGLGWVLALAIFVIYVVLEFSTRASFTGVTILSGLPSAGFRRPV